MGEKTERRTLKENTAKEEDGCTRVPVRTRFISAENCEEAKRGRWCSSVLCHSCVCVFRAWTDSHEDI